MSEPDARDRQRVAGYVEHALHRDPTVKFLFDKLRQARAGPAWERLLAPATPPHAAGEA